MTQTDILPNHHNDSVYQDLIKDIFEIFPELADLEEAIAHPPSPAHRAANLLYLVETIIDASIYQQYYKDKPNPNPKRKEKPHGRKQARKSR